METRQALSEAANARPGQITWRFRLLGLLPLAFFALHGNYYLERGELANMLWMCNISNLLLGVGLLLAQPVLIWAAVIWLIPGLPLWFYYVVLRGGWLWTSTVSHVGGLAVGLVALARVRADRKAWVYGLVWFLLVQQVSRMFTPPEWNINVAHIVYAGWEAQFTSYWMFWVATTAVTVAGLWVLGFILLKLFPPASVRE